MASLETRGFDTAIYKDSLANDTRIGSTEGIDAVLEKYNLDALVLPSEGYATTPAAIVGVSLSSNSNEGYPIVTVPLGTLNKTGQPFGLSFIGTVNPSISWLTVEI